MSDLARLRHMLLEPDHSALLLASMCHHLLPDPSLPVTIDYTHPPKIRDWILAAPTALFGPCIPSDPKVLTAIKSSLGGMEYQSLDMSAVLLRSARVADNPFMKTTRGETTGDVAVSRRGAAQHEAQSPIEFAAYDCLREAGYVDIKDAGSKLQAFLTATRARVATISRQFSRNRTATLLVYTKPGTSSLCVLLTPFFTSREAGRLFAAILLRDDIVSVSARAAAKRGATVLGYAARASLDAVRRLVEPAHAIIDQYRFDSRKLAFVDDRGEPVYVITDRTPSVVVAFSRVLSGGSCDPCVLASQKRTEINVPGGPSGAAASYFASTGTVPDTIKSAAVVLAASRADRAAHPGGQELNKDSGLTYFARDRSARDRNTASCVTRIEEVSALLRSRGRSVEDALFVVEWGGALNNDLVLAALALTGATACLDVGTGAFRLGDAPPDGDTGGDMRGAFVCLVPRAAERGLPRMPIVSYEVGDSISQRFDRLLEFVSSPVTRPSMAYISGGAAHSGAAPADVVGNTLARLSLASSVMPPGSFFCGDAMFPELCDCGKRDCLRCINLDYCVTAVGDECDASACSLVKPRASYAHNMHMSLEWLEGADRNWASERTLLTLDAVVATNVARNADWGGFVEGDGPRRPHHPAYGAGVKKLIDGVYAAMAMGSAADVGTTQSIVASLVGS